MGFAPSFPFLCSPHLVRKMRREVTRKSLPGLKRCPFAKVKVGQRSVGTEKGPDPRMPREPSQLASEVTRELLL